MAWYSVLVPCGVMEMLTFSVRLWSAKIMSKTSGQFLSRGLRCDKNLYWDCDEGICCTSLQLGCMALAENVVTLTVTPELSDRDSD